MFGRKKELKELRDFGDSVEELAIEILPTAGKIMALAAEMLERVETIKADIEKTCSELSLERMFVVNFNRSKENAREPTYAHEHDAGADLYAAHGAVLRPGEIKPIALGIKTEIPPGHFGLVTIRSGISFDSGLALINGLCIVDSGFRGEWRLAIVNNGKQEYTIRQGDRVAQVIFIKIEQPLWNEVEQLGESDRGESGYGSTGR